MIENIKKLVKLISKTFFYLIMDVVWLLSCIVPKDKNLWIFGAWFGQRYCDNPKYLFEYVKQNQKGIRAIWLTKNRKLWKFLRERDIEVYMAYSLKGFCYGMRAGVAIISSGMNDVNSFVLAHKKIVMLFHGTPLKKIGYDDKVFSNKSSSKFKSLILFIWRKIFPFTRERYNMIIATSEVALQRMASAFRVPLYNVSVAGYPRNDVLLSTKVSVTFLDKIQEAYKFKYLFFYLPTFRGEINSSFDLFTNYNFNVKKMEEVLAKLNGFLLIKTHPVNSIRNPTLLDQVKELKFIKIVDDTDIDGDIYPLLFYTDVLITDYSSVYFDYLLLNRPIIFAPFDIDEYMKKDREFYDNYYDVTPGAKAKNWDEVLMYIKEAIEEPEKYKKERERISKMFNQYQDVNSSERVYKAIMGRFYREAK